MRFGFILILLLTILLSFGSGKAWAHEGAALQAQEAIAATHTAAAPATGSLTPDRTGEHRHGSPGTSDCLAVGGCSGAGSVLGETYRIPVPQQVVRVSMFTVASTPRSTEPPVEDQPPRTI
ncbi:hypothetical protein BAL199_27486 [alpha proteobacterium BAL199]|jgi:hypothetical protein|nr:hypothetical protein BAL199_27486 [alpha proteobacterium BAL199]